MEFTLSLHFPLTPFPSSTEHEFILNFDLWVVVGDDINKNIFFSPSAATVAM